MHKQWNCLRAKQTKQANYSLKSWIRPINIIISQKCNTEETQVEGIQKNITSVNENEIQITVFSFVC